MTGPYADLPDHRFWRRAVAPVEAHLFDPVVAPRFVIGPEDRVATAGSCFAQHIARHLPTLGARHLVTESGDHLPEEERRRRQYGLFTARYGNIYTAVQLLQLHEEATGARAPDEAAWPDGHGRWVDPARPTVEPDGHASPAAVADDRARHLAAVRAMFAEADVLVFTLGLTEAWRSRRDGRVYPLAPGVRGGRFDPAAHEFVNFTAADTERALETVLLAMRARNPGLRVILTVSPVPLAATAEPRHVAVASSHSKAALLVAADALHRRHAWIDYFPSFEIIAASPTGGLYYEEDRRTVNRMGVAHAMRVFARHYLPAGTGRPDDGSAPAPERMAALDAGIICDEEAIDPPAAR